MLPLSTLTWVRQHKVGKAKLAQTDGGGWMFCIRERNFGLGKTIHLSFASISILRPTWIKKVDSSAKVFAGSVIPYHHFCTHDHTCVCVHVFFILKSRPSMCQGILWERGNFLNLDVHFLFSFHRHVRLGNNPKRFFSFIQHLLHLITSVFRCQKITWFFSNMLHPIATNYPLFQAFSLGLIPGIFHSLFGLKFFVQIRLLRSRISKNLWFEIWFLFSRTTFKVWTLNLLSASGRLKQNVRYFSFAFLFPNAYCLSLSLAVKIRCLTYFASGNEFIFRYEWFIFSFTSTLIGKHFPLEMGNSSKKTE